MADVSSTIQLWSTTAASNNPSGSTVVGTGMDDNLREIQSAVRAGLAHYNVTPVASSGTVDLNAATGNFLDISGTTTITAFGTASAGLWKVLRFTGALTLTHNGTSLILPGSANISTANGDVCLMYSLGSGNWKCAFYQRVDGSPIPSGVLILPSSTSPAQTTDASVVWDSDDDLLTVGTGAARKTMIDTDSTQTMAGKTLTAPVINTSVAGTVMSGQSDLETPSSTAILVSPGVMKYHPGVAKYWCQVTFSAGTPSITGASVAGGSVTDGGVGATTVNLPVTFSSTGNMCPVVTAWNGRCYIQVTGFSTSTVAVLTENQLLAATDINFFLTVYGDL